MLWIFWVSMLAIGVWIFSKPFQTRDDHELVSEPASPKIQTDTRIRSWAVERPQLSNAQEQTNQSTLGRCDHNGWMSEIQSDFEGFKLGLKKRADRLACKAEWRVSDECLAEPELASCEKQLIWLRAQLLSQIPYQSGAAEDLSLTANRLIASVADQTEDFRAVLKLADRLLEDDFQQVDVHKIRAFFGIRLMAEEWNEEIKSKVRDSIEQLSLSESSEEKDLSRILSYAEALAEFWNAGRPEALHRAEVIADSYLHTHPRNAKAAFMKMQVAGYQNKAAEALKWLEQGLEWDPSSEPQYARLKDQLTRGEIDLTQIGVRLDLENELSWDRLLGGR